jgi:hypothetical protein
MITSLATSQNWKEKKTLKTCTQEIKLLLISSFLNNEEEEPRHSHI